MKTQTQKAVKILSFFSHINQKIICKSNELANQVIYSGIVYVLRDVIAPYSKVGIIF